jgi:hypothetical protein
VHVPAPTESTRKRQLRPTGADQRPPDGARNVT